MVKKKCSKYTKIWAPPVIWAVLIFFLSSLTVAPSSKILWQDFLIKKSAHIVEYAILTILLYRGFRLSGYDTKRSAILSILIGIAYGVSDEIHQSFTPGRQPRVYDVIFDTIGALLAILILWKLLPRHQKFKEFADKLGLS